MLKANYKDSKYMGFDVPRGAFVCGRKSLSRELRLSERTVRTILTRLKTTSEIAIKSTNRFSIVFILNYNKYQDKTTNETTSYQSSERPATDQQPTTSKEVKNVRIKELNQKPGFLSKSEEQIVLKDIAKTQNVAENSESALQRLNGIVGEISKVKDVKNALSLARHKALNQK